MSLVDQIRIQMRTWISTQNPVTLLVAVSGGSDSVALLHALKIVSRSEPWKLVVVHFNHQLRAQQSDSDAAFVRTLAQNLEVECVVGHPTTPIASPGDSIEANARNARHHFFVQSARTVGANFLVTGHTSDDQVELFLMRLLRGAGLEGLGGMKPSTPHFLDDSIQIVRPLLRTSKAEILQYLSENSVHHKHDLTNDDTRWLRNFVRHNIVPMIRSKHMDGDSKILEITSIIQEASDYLQTQASKWLEYRPSHFSTLHPAIQREVVKSQLIENGWELSFWLIEQLRLHQDFSIQISPNLYVWRASDGTLNRKAIEGQTQWTCDSLNIDLRGSTRILVFGEKVVEWQLLEADSFSARPSKIRSTHGTEIFDAQSVGNTILLRHWRQGDAYQPIGMKGSVKLQDLFTNAKLPEEQRHQLLVATTDKNEVFWVEGFRIGDRFKVSETTTEFLHWSWKAQESISR